MTKAHVPPQAAGNTGAVTNMSLQIQNGSRVPGRSSPGGLWVRGLRQGCNGLAGRNYDSTYSDFARRLIIYARLANRMHLLRPWEPPAVTVAPGLVARSVLFGMFAINPQLRIVVPELANDLLSGTPHITMPQRLTLRFALFSGRRSRIAGPIGAHRVLTARQDFETLAEIFFSPLAWTLAPSGPRPSQGVAEAVVEAQGWACADDWLLYGPDVVHADLRDLAHRLPVVKHPLWEHQDEWLERRSDEITPIVEGVLPD